MNATSQNDKATQLARWLGGSQARGKMVSSEVSRKLLEVRDTVSSYLYQSIMLGIKVICSPCRHILGLGVEKRQSGR